MMIRILLALVVLVTVSSGAAVAEEATAAPPAWFTEGVEFQTRNGGRWIADNSAYKSADEPFDAYGIEWVAGPGNASMSGRLFGVQDGEETDVDFWRFSQYWDPARKKAVVEQYGWNVVGIGHLWTEDVDGVETIKMDQTFTDFSGASRREGHTATNPGPDSHETTSWSISEDGAWSKNRTYLWKRAKIDEASEDSQ